MTVDLQRFEPCASNWFTALVEYSGQGRAEFSDPPGVIEGSTRVRFDEFGNSSIEMDVEKMEPDSDDPQKALLFLRGSPPIVEGGKTTRLIGARKNPCSKLTVMCEDGVFSASDGIFYGLRSSFTRAEEHLTFHVSQSSFDVIETQAPRYWMLPLANFLADFRSSEPLLDRHPLRIFPTPTIPSDISERDAKRASIVADTKNRLIVFHFNDSPGFIEPLPDYKERQSRLVNGQERHVLTALMVGEVGDHLIDFAGLESWFPYDFISLLALAEGSEIGTPWMEFRGADGKLVRRAHVQLGRPAYTKGRKPIGEIHDGIGRLLSCATASPHWGKTYLRVAMKHLVRGGLSGLAIEDSLSCLCRALDALCEEFGLKKTLKSKDVLTDDRRVAVETTVSDSAKAIRDLAEVARKDGKTDEAELLDRVADRIVRAKSIEIGFGKAVVALLKHFNLPDGDILARHYEMNPRLDGRDWPEVVSMCRGTSMHRGYFDFRNGEADFDDVFRVFEHLHDVLLRIIFKMLGYEGTYQPTVAKSLAQASVDWVTPSTEAGKLGY